MHNINSKAYKQLCAKEDSLAQDIAYSGALAHVLSKAGELERLCDEAGLPATSRAIVEMKAQRIVKGTTA